MVQAALESREVDAPKPFLKWAGGKTQLLPQILQRFPEKFGRYYEPFIGGGAVFFRLRPRMAQLSDINPDLVGTYEAIRDNVDAVIKDLKKHRAESEYFYQVRAMAPTKLSAPRAASRTIFLNRTCFNGLYRVNRSGQFNVPFGKYANPTICDERNLRAVSRELQNVKLKVSSVFESVRAAKKGDLIYFDPPYQPLNPTSSFTSYTKQGFGEDQQAELAELFGDLANRGVHVVLSNSDTPLIRELYKDFRVEQVFARRAINSRASRRGPVSEVLVSSVS